MTPPGACRAWAPNRRASVAAALAALLVAAPPGQAQQPGALERLRSLAHAPPTAAEIYADEVTADLALIAAEAGALFDPARPGYGPPQAPVAIAMFTGPGCADCAHAEAELAALANRLGRRVAVIDVGTDPGGAALMQRLTLDLLPSYVLRDGLIRGAMPAVVLERYLTP